MASARVRARRWRARARDELRVLLLESRGSGRGRGRAPRAGRRPGCASTGRAAGGAGWRRGPGRTARAVTGVRGERRRGAQRAPGCAWSTACRSRPTWPARSAREVYAFWNAETLKAQAVVTRTYALHQRARAQRRGLRPGGRTPRDQVYGGVDAETPAVGARSPTPAARYLAWRRQADPRGRSTRPRAAARRARRRSGASRCPICASRRSRRGGFPRHLLAGFDSRAPHSRRALAPLGLRARPVREAAGDRADAERARARASSSRGDGGDRKLGERARAAQRARRGRDSQHAVRGPRAAATASSSSARATATASA